MQSIPRHSSRTRGFTLVELLVVIGIIAILGGLSFAYLSSSLARAKIAACSNNLRSIGVGMLAFAGDNNETFPESGASIPYGSIDPTTGLGPWTQQLEPYLGGKGTTVFKCPDSSHVISEDATYSYFNGGHAAYAQSGGFGAVSLVKMHDTSQHILAGDIAFGTFGSTDADKDDYTQDPAFNMNSGVIKIHGGSVNLLFADGHVQNAKSFDKLSMTTVYDGLGYDYLYPQQ